MEQKRVLSGLPGESTMIPQSFTIANCMLIKSRLKRLSSLKAIYLPKIWTKSTVNQVKR